MAFIGRFLNPGKVRQVPYRRSKGRIVRSFLSNLGEAQPNTSTTRWEKIYLEHTDAYGIVFYINHARFMAKAREHLIGRWIQGCLPCLTKIEHMQYSKPIFLHDDVEIKAEIKGRCVCPHE